MAWFNQNVCFGNAYILDDMLVHAFSPTTKYLCHPHPLLLVSPPCSDSSFQANPTRIILGNPKSCKLFSYLIILVKPLYFSIFLTYHNAFITISRLLLFFLNHRIFSGFVGGEILIILAPVPTPPDHKECQLTLNLKSSGGCFPPKHPGN